MRFLTLSAPLFKVELPYLEAVSHPTAFFIPFDLFPFPKYTKAFNLLWKMAKNIPHKTKEAIQGQLCFKNPYPKPLDSVRETHTVLKGDETFEEKVAALMSLAAEYRDDEAVLRRDRFVQEFLYDFNLANAYRRSSRKGKDLAQSTVLNYSRRMHQEPYVQLLIRLKLEEMDTEAICSRNRIIAGLLEEATYRGEDASHSARVAAWAKLGKYMGLDIDRSVSLNAHMDAPPELSKEVQENFIEKFKEKFHLESKT